MSVEIESWGQTRDDGGGPSHSTVEWDIIFDCCYHFVLYICMCQFVEILLILTIRFFFRASLKFNTHVPSGQKCRLKMNILFCILPYPLLRSHWRENKECKHFAFTTHGVRTRCLVTAKLSRRINSPAILRLYNIYRWRVRVVYGRGKITHRVTVYYSIWAQNKL